MRYSNRKGESYYLLKRKTKTGKPCYFFSKKNQGESAEAIPPGYEIYEDPRALVFLRKIPPKTITDEEINIIHAGIKQFSTLKRYLLDTKKNVITLYEADQDPLGLSDEVPFISPARERELLLRFLNYSAVLQFTLQDRAKRLFVVSRYCWRSLVDGWMQLDGPKKLEPLVKEYVKHLGKESFFDLF